MNLIKGMLIRFKSNPSRCWILLSVTKDEIKKGKVDVETAGLYAFGGMWYGRNPMKSKSYGKVDLIVNLDDVEIVKKSIQNLNVDQIKALVD